jgi:hypothetical protein
MSHPHTWEPPSGKWVKLLVTIFVLAVVIVVLQWNKESGGNETEESQDEVNKSEAQEAIAWLLRRTGRKCLQPQASTSAQGGVMDQIPGWVEAVFLVIVGIAVMWTMWGLALAPRWRVWAAHQEGLADLTQAKNEQQIQVAEAQGRVDAAQLNKKAAIIEAEAVAAQIETIGHQLTTHDLYLRWQWIKMMEENETDKVIYVPTEANLPILEARRLK